MHESINIPSQDCSLADVRGKIQLIGDFSGRNTSFFSLIDCFNNNLILDASLKLRNSAKNAGLQKAKFPNSAQRRTNMETTVSGRNCLLMGANTFMILGTMRASPRSENPPICFTWINWLVCLSVISTSLKISAYVHDIILFPLNCKNTKDDDSDNGDDDDSCWRCGWRWGWGYGWGCGCGWIKIMNERRSNYLCANVDTG